MLVQVKYSQQQKYVKLDEDEGRFDFMQFHEKVIERFCLPPDAKVIYKDATRTEVDAEIFSDLVGQCNVVLTVFSDQGEISKQLIEAVLRGKSGGEEVLQEYQTTETLTDAARRKMVNILVAHMIDNHGHRPTKAIREDYARGIVMLFPSLKDPYSKKGYEHFYDAASSTGYISWRLKTVQRKIRRGSALPPNSPIDVWTVNVERQLDGNACQEAMSLLNHTTDNSLIFQKMRETFQHRQKLVNDPGRSVDILSSFPRFLDTK
ncbi:uncharacterized protein LOC114560391 [Perca flavescens]|uniref:uncharacterized protein LOC114560391 n=1 Tax=Perca flavescens TaxID=8167 RepID=UPI00106E18EF|nr:uncharacterized protein LOC114560391 [Perca flavescens]